MGYVSDYTSNIDGNFDDHDDDGDDDGIGPFQRFVAKALGYLVGAGSLLLYTPIAVRVCRQKHADGLVLSTWWLKVASYLLSDMYYVRKRYDVSTYAETLIITVESAVVLLLVARYQRSFETVGFRIRSVSLVAYAFWGFLFAPDALVATGLLVSSVGNALALVPQFRHNYVSKTKGDYSPLTAFLAAGGCAIRVFTTVTLNGGDPYLMGTFLLAVVLNGMLFGQILYYGTVAEGLTVFQVLLADVVRAESHRDVDGDDGDGDGRDLNRDEEEEAVYSGFHDENDDDGGGGGNPVSSSDGDDDPTVDRDSGSEEESGCLRRRGSSSPTEETPFS